MKMYYNTTSRYCTEQEKRRREKTATTLIEPHILAKPEIRFCFYPKTGRLLDKFNAPRNAIARCRTTILRKYVRKQN